MSAALETSRLQTPAPFHCVACGGEIRPALGLLGSLRCHDCRDEGPGLVGHLETPLTQQNGLRRPVRR